MKIVNTEKPRLGCGEEDRERSEIPKTTATCTVLETRINELFVTLNLLKTLLNFSHVCQKFFSRMRHFFVKALSEIYARKQPNITTLLNVKAGSG